MGFEVSQTATLVFEEGHRLHGATVQVSLDMPIEEYLGLLRIARAWEAKGEGELDPDDLQDVVTLISRFGDNVLLSWDLAMKGEPLTADGAGMKRLPMTVAFSLFKAWSDAVSAPPPNSNGASENGGPSEAPSGQTAQS